MGASGETTPATRSVMVAAAVFMVVACLRMAGLKLIPRGRQWWWAAPVLPRVVFGELSGDPIERFAYHNNMPVAWSVVAGLLLVALTLIEVL